MARRITQLQMNTAREMFGAADLLTGTAKNFLMPEYGKMDIENLRYVEDQLLSTIFFLRQVRQQITATPIHEKGQRA